MWSLEPRRRDVQVAHSRVCGLKEGITNKCLGFADESSSCQHLHGHTRGRRRRRRRKGGRERVICGEASIVLLKIPRHGIYPSCAFAAVLLATLCFEPTCRSIGDSFWEEETMKSLLLLNVLRPFPCEKKNGGMGMRSLAPIRKTQLRRLGEKRWKGGFFDKPSGWTNFCERIIGKRRLRWVLPTFRFSPPKPSTVPISMVHISEVRQHKH